MNLPQSASSNRHLISRHNTNPENNIGEYNEHNQFMRAASALSARNIGVQQVLENDPNIGNQTVYQVDIENESLLRVSRRTELASKNQLLTKRWQTALVSGLLVAVLAGSIGGLAYWITIPKVITQPFLLYGASCYTNSRSCDATRLLWCPAGTCICTGNYEWNSTIENCTCGEYQSWNGIECQDYGSYGDPCNNTQCLPTLTCAQVVNQPYTTGQKICECDNTTYLDANTASSTYRTCIPRETYGHTCYTVYDCANWLGLSCSGTTTNTTCECGSTSYWNGTICVQQALGGDPCSITVPCDSTRGLTCSTTSFTCQCDSLSYWDNVTTFWCQSKKTYSISCQYSFQCNTTVNLSCPASSTGCNCPTASSAYICDCQAGNFWDGQECIGQHTFNGTCPGQYACTSNLVCYLGHCICPGNMVWNGTSIACQCPGTTSWNSVSNTCI